MRKFAKVREDFMKFPEVETKLPVRADNHSAGYDFYSKEDVDIEPGSVHVFWTDVKAVMFFDNVLQIYTRSGNGVKYGVILRNGTGIIDASYANNESNDGNICIALENTGNRVFSVKKGDRIAQGIFIRYLITDDDKYLVGEEKKERKGGLGSTGK